MTYLFLNVNLNFISFNIFFKPLIYDRFTPHIGGTDTLFGKGALEAKKHRQKVQCCRKTRKCQEPQKNSAYIYIYEMVSMLSLCRLIHYRY